MFNPKCLYTLCLIVLGTSGYAPNEYSNVQCVQNYLQPVVKGMPDRGVPAAEPLPLKDTGVNFPELTWKSSNAKYNGLKNCEVTKFDYDKSNSKTVIEIICPMILGGNYTLNGTLFDTPVEGNGYYEYDTDKIKFIVTTTTTVYKGGDDKDHWFIVDYSYTHKTINTIIIKVDNLFDGKDPEKAEKALKAINDNWEAAITNVAQPVFDKLCDAAINYLNIVFAIVPIDGFKC